MSSLSQALVARATAVVAATLLAAGLVTAVTLHTLQVRMLDRVLTAAAVGRAHPEVEGRWEVEDVDLAVEAFEVRRDDPRVPEEAVARALRAERPVFADHGERRVVVLVAEQEGHGEHREQHLVVAAAAPRPRLWRTVGRFALVYGCVASLATAAAALALSRATRAAFAPVERARLEASRVLALGQGQRLTEDGPDEVRSLLAALNALLDRLEVAHLAQTRFTAEAAHELRTPVTAMLGELDVALRRPREADAYREVLASTREEVDRLRRLVEGLLALARLDAGEAGAERETRSLAALAREAVAAEHPTLSAAGCEVSLEVVEDSEARVQPALVAAALGNLLRNAARHAPGAPVVVRVGREGGLAVVDVDDGGRAPSPAEREAVFDRFVRGGEARRRDHAGLGLGLPIAREIARRHGGDCVLLEAPGGGTRARLTLAG